MQFMAHLQLAASLKKGGGRSPQQQDIHCLWDVLLLLRHGERFDHVDRSYKGFDPPLSPQGRLQSLETALFFRRLQRDNELEARIKGLLSVLLSSPFHRCIETALIINVVGFGGSLPFFINPLLCDWLQTKVFRVSPNLRGYYGYTKDESVGTADAIYYKPDIVSLQSDLSLFFESFAKDNEFLKANKLQSVTTKEWVQRLNSWCDAHFKIIVWTSPSTQSSLQVGIESCSKIQVEELSDFQGLSTKEVQKRNESTTERNSEHFNSCGISFPENRRGLLHRCEEFMNFLFNVNSNVKPWDLYVPSSVVKVIKVERRNLPSNWKPRNESIFPAANTGCELSVSFHSLLPPMHVLCVTHADVVGGIVESVCPKLYSPSFVAVPYCSLTVLRRQNNFYRIEPYKEDGHKDRRRKDLNKPQLKNRARLKTSNVKVVTQKDAVPSTSPSMVWKLEEFASLKAVETKIVLRYS